METQTRTLLSLTKMVINDKHLIPALLTLRNLPYELYKKVMDDFQSDEDPIIKEIGTLLDNCIDIKKPYILFIMDSRYKELKDMIVSINFLEALSCES